MRSTTRKRLEQCRSSTESEECTPAVNPYTLQNLILCIAANLLLWFLFDLFMP